VKLVAVVGVADATRTEIIKAFIVLNDSHVPGDALRAELQQHVRHRLAAHEYPREIEFVASLPMTTTGKVMRRELRRGAVTPDA
jgi:acetyl-CoA synthetase